MLRKKLNIYYRIFATGFCFSTFGIGALVLVSSVFPIIILFNRKSHKKSLAVRKAIQISFKAFVWLMSVMRLISVSVKNFEPALESRGQIIIANHPSLIDIVILISLLPQSDCIVKESLSRNFFLKNVIKAAYIFSSIQIDELFEDCKKSLADGNSFIIFPEGTRTVPGKQHKLSRGAAQLAVATEADILPIHISCTPPGLLKNQKWYHVAETELTYVLETLPIISIKSYLDDENSKNSISKKLTKKIERIIL